jgi:hypothetical protein
MPQSDKVAAQSLQITLNRHFFQIFSGAAGTLPWPLEASEKELPADDL